MAEPKSQRWAQLSYASYDAGTGSGGWQVKQVTGDPTADELAQMSARVVTAFNGHVALRQFPSSDELESLPRRFSYCSQDDGSALYLHAVQSGDDSTGRPGNVFSHAILDRRPSDLEPELHPIQLWRSPGLLAPFGAGNVLSAEFTANDYPGHGSAISLDSTLAFILDADTWRVGLLCVLLDALADSLEGGPRVVFIAASPDTAALWLGAVSYLTSTAVSRTLSWSLYERASGLDAAFSRGLHFVAVPDIDADLVKATSTVVVINESESPTLGAIDESPHRTAAGSEVEVTEWSEMAQMVLIEADVARHALSTISDVARRVGDRSLHVAWPLAMSIATLGDDGEDALPYATTVILASSPLSIRTDPILLARAVELADLGAGSSAADLWSRLQAIDRNSAPLGYYLLAGPYLERSILDRAWITQPGGCPLPEELPTQNEASALRLVAESTLRAAFDDADTSIDGAVYHLRLVDLVLRAGIVTDGESPFSPLSNIATDLLCRAASAQLSDPGVAADLVARVGKVGPGIRSVVRGLAQEWPIWDSELTEPGHRHDPQVMDWLFYGAALPAHPTSDVRIPAITSGFGLELAIWMDGHDDAPAGLWALIASGMLVWYRSWAEIPEPWHRRLLSHSHTVSELSSVEEHHEGELPDSFFVATLAAAEWGPDLRRLCAALSRSRPDLQSRRFALLRIFCAGSEAAAHSDKVSPSAAMRSAIELFRVARNTINWDAIGPVVLMILVLDLEGGHPDRVPEPHFEMIRSIRDSTAVTRMVDSAITLLLAQMDILPMSETMLRESALLALTTSAGFPVSLARRLAPMLGRLESPRPGGGVRLVEARLQAAIARGEIKDIGVLAASVRTAVVSRLREQGHSDARQYDVDIRRVDEFSRNWWLKVGRTAPMRHEAAPPRFGNILEEKKDY
jgi:hypothetical protein